MKPIIRNIFAVVAGIVAGGAVNMGYLAAGWLSEESNQKQQRASINPRCLHRNLRKR